MRWWRGEKKKERLCVDVVVVVGEREEESEQLGLDGSVNNIIFLESDKS